MIVISLIWILISLLMDSVCVQSQVCSSRRIVMKQVMENQQRWYRETYNGECYYGCIKSRWATKIEQVPVMKREVQVYHECCDGYIHIDDETNGVANETMPITCKPICMPGCKNGICNSPGICSCNPGYSVDPADEHNCLPLCQKDCQHGSCIAPETCQCNFGYNIVNGTCQPDCTEPCDNGTCVSPETCQCLLGYRKSDRNTCEPYCSSGCLHGSCVSPETCVCSPGFSKQVIDTENNTSCQPVCSPPCHNGTCVAPNVCECIAGYQIFGGNNCKPHCLSGCPNGSCIKPETCICNDGWRMDNNSVCEPICDVVCGNGTCVSPNTCDCHRGYKLNSKDLIESPMCVPICKNCEGKCVNPNVCICGPPFEVQNLTADGKTCDCHDNCTDGMRKCERTICTIIVKATSLDIDETTEEFSSSSIEASTIDYNNWTLIYVASTLFTIFVIILITIVVIKWKCIIIYFKGSSYIVEDDKEIAAIGCSLRYFQEKRGVKPSTTY